ncbi:MAG: hypothetical protein ACLQVA_11310 [Candidatus Brocadiia bacterium]
MLKSMQLWGHHTQTLQLAHDMQFIWLETSMDSELPNVTPRSVFPRLRSLTIGWSQLEPNRWRDLLLYRPQLVHFTCLHALEVPFDFAANDWKEEERKGPPRAWQTFDVHMGASWHEGLFLPETLIDVFANPSLSVWRVSGLTKKAASATWTKQHSSELYKRLLDDEGQTSLSVLELPFKCDTKESDAVVRSLTVFPRLLGVRFLKPVAVSSETLQRILEAWADENELPADRFTVERLSTQFSVAKRTWPLKLDTVNQSDLDMWQDWTDKDFLRLLLTFSRWDTIKIHEGAVKEWDAKTLQTLLVQNRAVLTELTVQGPCVVDRGVLDAAAQCLGQGVLTQLWLGDLPPVPKEVDIEASALQALVEAAARTHTKKNIVLQIGIMKRLTARDILDLARQTARHVLWSILVPLTVGEQLRRDMQEQRGPVRVTLFAVFAMVNKKP